MFEKIILDKKGATILYREIADGYNLLNEISSVIETAKKSEESQKIQVELVYPVVIQMREAFDLITEKYIQWVKNGLKATKKDIDEVEAIIRKAFQSCDEFIQKIKDMFPNDTQNIDQKTISLKDTIRKVEKKILPSIGDGVGELIHGPAGIAFYEEIIKLPSLRRLIQAVKNVMDHLFKITYCFLSMDNGLVSDPNKVSWGRKIPDAKAKELLRKQKSERQKLKTMNSTFLTRS